MVPVVRYFLANLFKLKLSKQGFFFVFDGQPHLSSGGSGAERRCEEACSGPQPGAPHLQHVEPVEEEEEEGGSYQHNKDPLGTRGVTSDRVFSSAFCSLYSGICNRVRPPSQPAGTFVT